MAHKKAYVRADQTTCSKCHQGTMRVVLTRLVGSSVKEQVACDNTHCDHMLLRSQPQPCELADDDADDSGD